MSTTSQSTRVLGLFTLTLEIVIENVTENLDERTKSSVTIVTQKSPYYYYPK